MISYEPLYELLVKLNGTITGLSTELGYFKSTIGTITSKHQSMSAAMLDKICTHLNCSPGDVFEILPDDAVIEHRRTCNQSSRKPKHGGADSVKVDWEKLTSAIKDKGYSYLSLSTAMGKPAGFIGRKKQSKCIAPASLDLITSFLDLDSKEFIIDKVQ